MKLEIKTEMKKSKHLKKQMYICKFNIKADN